MYIGVNKIFIIYQLGLNFSTWGMLVQAAGGSWES